MLREMEVEMLRQYQKWRRTPRPRSALTARTAARPAALSARAVRGYRIEAVAVSTSTQTPEGTAIPVVPELEAVAVL